VSHDRDVISHASKTIALCTEYSVHSSVFPISSLSHYILWVSVAVLCPRETRSCRKTTGARLHKAPRNLQGESGETPAGVSRHVVTI
jgi:hypothetical protein